MKTRDEFTGLAYDIEYKGDANGGWLHLAHNGTVRVAQVPRWCADLAMEARAEGNVILAQAILGELSPW